MDKKEARKLYRDIRKNLPASDREKASLEISDKIIKIIQEEEYKQVLCYAALPEEVNIDSVFERLKESVKFFFPRVNGDIMEFYQVEEKEDLETGNFNVREPKTDCRILEYNNDKYLMLVPGMAFDEKGYRLGYGKGYYDKYLALNKAQRIHTLGVCFSKCLAIDIPHDEFDVRIDRIITEE